MLDGRIEVQGDVFDLRQQGLLKEIAANPTDNTNDLAERNGTLFIEGGVAENYSADEESFSNGKTTEHVTADIRKRKKDTRGPKKLVDDERIAKGRVNFSVYRSYLIAS